MDHNKVKKVFWFTSADSIGIVVMSNGKAYIGKANGVSEKYDITKIKEYGAKIKTSDLHEILRLMEDPNGGL